MEVLQTSALPLGDGAGWNSFLVQEGPAASYDWQRQQRDVGPKACIMRCESGAGNGIRTRDFDLGKVALYH